MLHKFSDCYYILIKTSGGVLEKLNLDFPLGSASEGQLGERFGEEDIYFILRAPVCLFLPPVAVT